MSDLCNNKEDIYTNKYKNSINLIIIQIKENNFMCLTRFEFYQIIKSYDPRENKLEDDVRPIIEFPTDEKGKILAYIESEDKRYDQRTRNLNNNFISKDVAKKKADPKYYHYRLPHNGIWVDSSIEEMFRKKVNTMKLVLKKNGFLHRGYLMSEMHDYQTDIYSVEPLNRCSLFESEECTKKGRFERDELNHFNDDIVIDETEEVDAIDINMDEIKQMGETRKLLKQISDDKHTSIIDIKFSPDGTTVACCQQHFVSIWDAITHKYKYSLEKYMKTPYIVEYSMDGKYMIVNDDKTKELFLWDTNDASKPLLSMHIGQRLQDISFGKNIILYSALKSVTIMDINLQILSVNSRMKYSDDEKSYVRTYKKEIIINTESKDEILLIEDNKDQNIREILNQINIYGFFIFIDNNTKLVNITDIGTFVWDINKHQVIKYIAHYKFKENLIPIYNKKRNFIFFYYNGNYEILNLETFEHNEIFNNLQKEWKTAIFDISENGNKIAIVINGNEFKILDIL